MNRTRLFFAGAAALGLMWTSSAWAADPPAPPASLTAPAATVIEPAALALLQKAERTIFGLRTYQADCWTTSTRDHDPIQKPLTITYEGATLIAAKPNKMRYDQWACGGTTPDEIAELTQKYQQNRPTGKAVLTFVCDGKTNWRQYGDFYNTDKRTAPQMLGTILEPWVGFYAKTNSPYGEIHYYQKQKPNGVLEARTAGSEPVNGVPCGKVFTRTKSTYKGEVVESRTTWFIGARDGLVRRRIQWVSFGGKPGLTSDAVLRNIRTNARVANPAKTFAYTPPKGVITEQNRKQAETAEPVLLAAGTPAPDFVALDKDNKPVKLSDFKSKVVVVDFWASWCPPCVAAMPHNQDVTQKLQKEGVPFVLLAVDSGEDRAPFLAWVKKHESVMGSVLFVHVDPAKNEVSGKLYHVSGIPTQYVIDANGVIRTSFVGYDGPTDDLEKAIRAAAVPK